MCVRTACAAESRLPKRAVPGQSGLIKITSVGAATVQECRQRSWRDAENADCKIPSLAVYLGGSLEEPMQNVVSPPGSHSIHTQEMLNYEGCFFSTYLLVLFFNLSRMI